MVLKMINITRHENLEVKKMKCKYKTNNNNVIKINFKKILYYSIILLYIIKNKTPTYVTSINEKRTGECPFYLHRPLHHFQTWSSFP